MSDKPVIVTNGNFNGQYASDNDGINGSDILMDQSVPVERLGQEFILVKGNGANSFGSGENVNTMERAIIVATEDNTEIYLNGSATPIAVINAGEHYLTLPDSYVLQGFNHYNMYIKTSKNVYIYQLLAGVEFGDAFGGNGNGQATGGMNFIPPLSCYLPKKIDEIGFIDQNRVYSNNNLNGIDSIPTKLNIITVKGAEVNVESNGNTLTLTDANGPFNVNGTEQWETYSVPNVTGNISIFSTKAVTAGISAGDDAVGYGGYFAGFSATPLIQKIEGECVPDVKLAVIEGFQSYKWLLKDNDGNYNEAPGTNDLFYYSPTSSGIYAVDITEPPCNKIRTPDFKFFNCTDYTNYNYNICTTTDINFPQTFILSSQTINPNTLTIIESPTKGTATVNYGNKTITYTVNPGESGIDKFKYTFCGINPIPDCETIQATIFIHQVVSHDTVLRACSSDGIATYNLSEADVVEDTDVTKVYYHTQIGAENETESDIISNFTDFTTADTTVYVRIKNSFSCFSIQAIQLKFKPNPVVQTDAYTTAHCDEEDGVIDGNYIVNPNNITPFVLTDFQNFDVKYYNSETKANLGADDNIVGNYTFTAANPNIWIRVTSSEDCTTVRKIPLIIGKKISLLSYAPTVDYCDDDLDGIKLVENLGDYAGLFTDDANAIVRFYLNLTDAQNGINDVSEVLVDHQRILYVRISNGTDCDELATLTIHILIPNASIVLENEVICPNTTAVLNAGPGFTKYEWHDVSDTDTIIGTEPIITVGVGSYSVTLTSPNGCSYTQYVQVTEAEMPVIESIGINGSTVTVIVTGGTPPYQYALDNGVYQNSNVFTNVPPGLHTAYAISGDKCTPAGQEFSVIEIYNVLSPNNDGYNDVLDMSMLKYKVGVKFQIYDRNGVKVFEGTPNNNYIWNGKLSGRVLPTSSYWYIMEWQDYDGAVSVKYTGWFLLKNRN